MKNRIVITGHTGLVGGSLISSLKRRHVATGISLSTGHDVSDFSSLDGALPDFDLLVHCAASFAGDTPEGIAQNESVNSTGALNACRLAASSGCSRVILISSISAIRHPDNEYFGSYALSKLHAEENSKLFCDASGMKLTVLRFSQIYDSAGVSAKHQPFLYQIIDKVTSGEKVYLHGDNDPRRNYIFIDDVTEIINRFIDTGIEGFFNCVHPQSHAISDIIAIAGQAASKAPTVIRQREKADIRNIFIPDYSLPYKEIGFEPAVDLAEGIKRIIGKKHEKI
ncbi:MAG TPA: NAD(P)-dependent oxidoreductase [bacterium]|nr:NAD(P)-dependent oxidoreductase [bacterium]